jgi:hypothetical protein
VVLAVGKENELVLRVAVLTVDAQTARVTIANKADARWWLHSNQIFTLVYEEGLASDRAHQRNSADAFSMDPQIGRGRDKAVGAILPVCVRSEEVITPIAKHRKVAIPA